MQIGLYNIISSSGARHDLTDAREFIVSLDELKHRGLPHASTLFKDNREIVVTRAPGRLDVMGGIADYSGSLVLQLPIAEATFAALQKQDEKTLRIVSLLSESRENSSNDNPRELYFEMPMKAFERNGEVLDYAAARAMFARDKESSWAAYVAGAFLILMRERNVRFDKGARLLIASHVPEGKGVSSSAALEVAAMSAIAAAFNIELEARELAVLCQKLENLIVGAPCGVMDQMTSVCGQADELLELLCQPAELKGTIKLPDDLQVWGIDSGVRHSVGGGDYGSVRIGAFIGYRIIAEIAGFEVSAHNNGKVGINDSQFKGYLANITPSEFETRFAAHLPQAIAGTEFLHRYQGTTDSVTSVVANKTYAVLHPTRHPIYEHARVKLFAELLQAEKSLRRNELLGELMYQSHASYERCGLGSDGTNLLVNLVRQHGHNKGLYGAKITGGGSGGTVAILAERGSDAVIEKVVNEYERQTNYRPRTFADSSIGAAAFGFITILKRDLEHLN